MIKYPTAFALTAAFVSVGLSAFLAALIVSAVVYALDWASREDDWKADHYLRRLVYLGVNTLILSLTVSRVLSLDTLGLG
jgi:ABC-type Fe3+ transport system permease subunit